MASLIIPQDQQKIASFLLRKIFYENPYMISTIINDQDIQGKIVKYVTNKIADSALSIDNDKLKSYWQDESSNFGAQIQKILYQDDIVKPEHSTTLREIADIFRDQYKKPHSKEQIIKKLNFLSRDDRKLDSLARLMELNDICAAVAIDKEKRQFVIGYNNYSRGVVDKYQETNKILFAHLQRVKDKKVNQLERIELLNNIIKLKTKIKFSTAELKKILENIKDLAITSLEDIQQTIPKRFSQVEKGKIARLIVDLIKLENYMDHCEEKSSQELFQTAVINAVKKEIDYLGSTGGKNQKVHAEMRVLEALLQQNEVNKLSYIGISKSSCLRCADFLSENGYIYRGSHGRAYGEGARVRSDLEMKDFELKNRWQKSARLKGEEEGQYFTSRGNGLEAANSDSEYDMSDTDMKPVFSVDRGIGFRNLLIKEKSNREPNSGNIKS